jgi:hypothetical protein
MPSSREAQRVSQPSQQETRNHTILKSTHRSTGLREIFKNSDSFEDFFLKIVTNELGWNEQFN